jgi:hypothetical protein
MSDGAAMKIIKNRSFIGWIAFLIILSALIAIYMHPAVTSCGGSVIGNPGDGTAGGVWRAWIWKVEHSSLFAGHTSMSGYPLGESLFQPIHVTALAWLVPLWMFSKVVSAPCAWNLDMALGLFATGVAMFALVKWLTKSWLVSTFAALAFTFAPYRQLKMQGHIGYVHSEGVPLFILASFMIWEKQTKLRMLFLGLSLALMAYTDGYYILIGGVLLLSLHLSLFLFNKFHDHKSFRDLKQPLLGVLGGLCIGGALCLPIAYTILLKGSAVRTEVNRNITELYTYSARLWEYVVPTHSQPIYGSRYFGNFRLNHLHGSNPSEQTLYLGAVVMLLCIFSVGALYFRHRKKTLTQSPIPYLKIVTAMLLVGAAGVLVSLSPKIHLHLFGLTVPGISGMIFSVFTLWRVYARLYILVDAAAVVVAAIGLYMLIERRTSKTKVLIVIPIIVICLIDQLTYPPLQHFEYASSPDVYKWIATQPTKAIAEYPMHSLLQSPDGEYFTYQPVTGKPMINARVAGTSDGIQQSLSGLEDPDTARVLRANGVNLIIVHPSFFGEMNKSPLLGYKLVKSFRYANEFKTRPKKDRLKRFLYLKDFYDADVYEVPKDKPADAEFSYVEGFYGPEVSNWKAGNWMEQSGTTKVVSLNGSRAKRSVSLDLASFATPKHVVVKDGNKVLWSGTVGNTRHVAFTVVPGHSMNWIIKSKVLPANKVIKGVGDGRTLGLHFSNVDVE